VNLSIFTIGISQILVQMLSDEEISELIASEARSQKEVADRIGPKAYLVRNLLLIVEYRGD
jgi:hypothetical protein